MEDKTVAGLLGLIEADRNGEAVDKTLLKHLVRMFTSLGTYASAFEEAFLDKTKQYYSLEGRHYMQESDVADYLLHCEVWVLPCLSVRLYCDDRQPHGLHGLHGSNKLHAHKHGQTLLSSHHIWVDYLYAWPAWLGWLSIINSTCSAANV